MKKIFILVLLVTSTNNGMYRSIASLQNNTTNSTYSFAQPYTFVHEHLSAPTLAQVPSQQQATPLEPAWLRPQQEEDTSDVLDIFEHVETSFVLSICALFSFITGGALGARCGLRR